MGGGGGALHTEDAAPGRPGPPWIFVDDLENARDVGGVVAPGAQHVAYGALFRGPPLRLSAEGCAEFARRGIRTVIDLRIGSEQTAPPACVTDRARLVLAPLPVPYNVSPADYVAILDASASIAAIFQVLSEAAAFPVYAHCTWGRDRTGVVSALVLSALGVSRQDVLREYALSEASVGAFPGSLEAALDEVEGRGGVEAYLAGASVTPEQIRAIRARLLVPAEG